MSLLPDEAWQSGVPLIVLAVLETGEMKYSARAMTLEQCEMVLSKMNEIRQQVTVIGITVEAERDFRAAEAA
ncbi:MAG: hypothetical protein HOD58_11880 [Gammaproteobacteria bacterium]|nr:hypothetical protein [Gammaproteobacteria bacterium]MBT4330616.1 hypothetical protein [Gammaproteobacteria bacterium]MBT4812532.1 hypothetical protein [Thiotrichales bacterium]